MTHEALPYRPNVGAILRRSDERLLLCERLRPRGTWQFPQGGIDPGESHEEAMWREVGEELGLLSPKSVCEIVGRGPATHYDFGPGYDAPIARLFRGQLQTLFLIDFHGDDSDFDLQRHDEPEFASTRWVRRTEVLDLMWNFKSVVVQETFRALADELAAGFGSGGSTR